jgi:hypothetical protein
MMKVFRCRFLLAVKKIALCAAILCGLYATAMTRAEASASCTAVNSASLNLTNPPADAGNTAVLSSWTIGDRITAAFTDALGLSHTEAIFSGPITSIGTLTSGIVSSGGSLTLMHTVTSSDLTNGILLDPENNDSVTATCIVGLVLMSTPSSTLHVGQAYSQTNAASGGTSPYTYSVSAGSLPAGVSLNASTGLVSGTPTVGGNFNYTIAVSDSSPAPVLTASQTLSGTINGGTTTTVNSSADPSALNFPVTFTASVAGSGGTPTGTVTFTDGTTTLGTGALASGTATFTTSTLTMGTHSISASYAGDANFGSSTSPTFTQLVEIANTYVSPRNGRDSDNPNCPITSPCATLNKALSVTGMGGQITVLGGGQFGPIVLTGPISITGSDFKQSFEIVADPTAQVGCIGLPAGVCSVNNGYGVEIAAHANDSVNFTNVTVTAGVNGTGALKLMSGGMIQLSNNLYRGNDSGGPIVALYPNNPGTTQAEVYFSNSDIGFNTDGAVEVKPGGSTSLKVHFNHVEVHNANYGVRTDSSLLASPAVNLTTAISESEFFSLANAAMNAFTTSGTGTTIAVFDTVRILNAGVGIKANGPLSTVVMTDSTVSGNGTGITVQSGGHVFTPHNNTITGNGTNVSGSVTSAPPL